jgi:hypothetical protein
VDFRFKNTAAAAAKKLNEQFLFWEVNNLSLWFKSLLGEIIYFKGLMKFKNIEKCI